ncbi:hypothetical protein NUW58_g1333 [Xylaria curta]|uniref:Uncharacterized protein n=1 Tax=Xylaria curta TaxID=42375 RepID=A0ACC1PKS0_9PEZI|nr:hypothetical protein NUW58_g1333 [Xylaria curta]
MVPATTSVFGNGADVQAHGEPDEDDLDALMAEEEAQRSTTSASLFGNGKMTQAQQTRREPDDDDDLDALMAEAEAEPSFTKPTRPTHHKPAAKPIIDDDEDDLDALMAEAEAEDEVSTARKSPSPKVAMITKGSSMVVHDVDKDEEAAMAEMEGLW